MDLQKFRLTLTKLNDDISKNNHLYLIDEPILFARLQQAVSMAAKILPDHKHFFETAWTVANKSSDWGIDKDDAIKLCNYTLELIDSESTTEKKIEERKLFQSAKDKLIEAGKSLRNDDLNSVLNNLNTSLELALKEKLSIPTTIPNIKTANIIEILVKHNLGPVDYLKEVKKHVFTDNKVKHVGYVPSKIECINAIKSVEELFQKLDKMDTTIDKEVRDKIFNAV